MEKDLQQKYMQYQMYQQQLQQMQQNIQLLQNQSNDVNNSIKAIEDLGNSEIGSDLLAPISSGIFVRSELKEKKKVSINIGSNIVVEKSLDDAKTLLSEQLDEINNMKSQLQADFQKVALKFNVLQQELAKAR